MLTKTKTSNAITHPNSVFLLNTDKREGAAGRHVAVRVAPQQGLEVQCGPSDTCLIIPSICDRVPIPGNANQF